MKKPSFLPVEILCRQKKNKRFYFTSRAIFAAITGRLFNYGHYLHGSKALPPINKKAPTGAFLFIAIINILIPVAVAWAAVVTTATATIAAAVSAAAAASRRAATKPAAAATGRALALIGLFYYQWFFAQRNIVEVLNGIAAILVIHHFYKSKAAAFTCFFIHGYFSRRDRTKFFEYLNQLVVKQIVREAGYKKFHTENYGTKIQPIFSLPNNEL
jgi:hypothetical protein